MNDDFCLSYYLIQLKRHSVDKRIANEILVGTLFEDICTVCEVKNEAGDEYFNSKELASLLINRQVSMPKTIKLALQNNSLQTISKAVGFGLIEAKILNENEIPHLLNALKESYVKSPLHARYQKLSFPNNSEALAFYLIESSKIENQIVEKEFDIASRGASEVSWMYGDLMKIGFNTKNSKEHKIIVIPVDKDFHMRLSSPDDQDFCVSPNTLHGKWIARIEKKGLSGQLNSIRGKGKIGEVRRFMLNKGNTFYLLACSEFNKDNVAHSSEDMIKRAISKLIAFYDEKGQGYPLYVPLIGTGSSRAGLSNDKSFKILSEIFSKSIEKINGKIIIVRYFKQRNK